MAARASTKQPETAQRMNLYLDPATAAWVRDQAQRQGRTASGFVRHLLTRVRAEMAHSPTAGGILEGGVRDHP